MRLERRFIYQSPSWVALCLRLSGEFEEPRTDARTAGLIQLGGQSECSYIASFVTVLAEVITEAFFLLPN